MNLFGSGIGGKFSGLEIVRAVSSFQQTPNFSRDSETQQRQGNAHISMNIVTPCQYTQIGEFRSKLNCVAYNIHPSTIRLLTNSGVY